ncbi:hypothetical protein KSP39_PZI022288 [Platanthera zijinensis]|uniref:Uncharacterized protein n=1 Tax=Platanthera zijinensis TaxID=2320716 RepID=A0AAP0FVB1_9ASPA
MMEAKGRLLAYALLDFSNYRFILLSESTSTSSSSSTSTSSTHISSTPLPPSLPHSTI